MKRLSLNSLISRFEARIMASVYLHQLVVKSGISLSSEFIFQPPAINVKRESKRVRPRWATHK